MAFYTPIIRYQKEKLRKQSHLQLQQPKSKVHRYKFNQGSKKPVLRKLQITGKKIEEDTNK